MATTPEKLAEKIAAKAAETLARLELEMTVMKWPREFRAIMWGAVAHEATLRAAEQKPVEASPDAT